MTRELKRYRLNLYVNCNLISTRPLLRSENNNNMALPEPFSTTWPDSHAPPASVQKWVDDFYHLADNQDADAGDRLAALFTSEGVMHGMAGALEGREAISASRPKAWITQKSRRHDPVQIYMGKADYSEILVQGKIKSWFKTGEVVEAEFIAGISFEFENGQQEAKCWRYRVWGDSAPWVKAMSKQDQKESSF